MTSVTVPYRRFQKKNYPKAYLRKACTLTGWSISILHILTGWYDKNNACTKKIVVDLFSVYRDISSKTHNLKFLKFLLSKKLNSKLGSILAQNSTYNFEAV